VKYKDYYAILGLERSASEDEIKKAYRRLARKYHPDVSKEKDAEEKFKDVNEAYQTLSDAAKRKAYDQLGQRRPGEDFQPPPDWGSQFGGGAGGFGGFGGGGGRFDDVDLADLFAQFGGAAGMGGGRGRVRPRAGQDVEVVAEITLEQAAFGTELQLTLSEPEVQDDGRVLRVPRTLQVKVPAGSVAGQRLRLAGKGGPGAHGGPPGDLYVDLRLREHGRYRVEGRDLYLDLPIAPWEAVLGAEIEVPTLDGRVTVKVRPGMRAGQKMRLTGKGLPSRKGEPGDLYLVLAIVAPSVIGERERELYRELAAASNFNPRANLS
jgi:curved DNA-binding protein